jgi:putative FmdB family regulatory protein
MAIYEYICVDGHEYTEERAMTEEQKTFTCPKPKCDKELKRVFFTPAITFKGPGFYSSRG